MKNLKEQLYEQISYQVHKSVKTHRWVYEHVYEQINLHGIELIQYKIFYQVWLNEKS